MVDNLYYKQILVKALGDNRYHDINDNFGEVISKHTIVVIGTCCNGDG